MTEGVESIEKLKAVAQERWGDGWTIRQLHFADGATSAHAFRTYGHPEESLTERERLFRGADGGIYHDRVVIEEQRIVDVLERDDPPEDIASEIRPQPSRDDREAD